MRSPSLCLLQLRGGVHNARRTGSVPSLASVGCQPLNSPGSRTDPANDSYLSALRVRPNARVQQRPDLHHVRHVSLLSSLDPSLNLDPSLPPLATSPPRMPPPESPAPPSPAVSSPASSLSSHRISSIRSAGGEAAPCLRASAFLHCRHRRSW
jgi:hypothetical protein